VIKMHWLYHQHLPDLQQLKRLNPLGRHYHQYN
jgi:hypothetical protein